jgi:hypothetical protein
MSRLHAGVVAISLMSLLLVDGCSFIFVEKVPDGWQRRPFPPDCTASVAPPVIDTVFGVGDLLAYVGTPDSETDIATGETKNNKDLKYAYLGFGALYAASAIYGYQNTGSCRSAKREKEQEADENYDDDRDRKKKQRRRHDDEESMVSPPLPPGSFWLQPPYPARRAAWLPSARPR